jgi:dsRNA-specific ribonuclease
LQRLVLGYYRVNTALDRYLQYSVDERPDLRGRVRATVTIVLDLPTAGNDAYRVLRFTGQRDTNQRTAEQTAAMMAFPKCLYYFEMRTRTQQQRPQNGQPGYGIQTNSGAASGSSSSSSSSSSAATVQAAISAPSGSVNYKNILQEWAQRKYRGVRPVEDVLIYSPAPATPATLFSVGFRSQVAVLFPNGQQAVYLGEAMTGTKKASEQEAARVALASGRPEFAGLCPGLTLDAAPTSPTASSATATTPSHAPGSAACVAPASSSASAGAGPYTSCAFTTSSSNSGSAASAPSGNYKDALQRWVQATYRNRLPIERCLIYDVYAIGSGGFQASLQVLVNEATGEYLSFRSTAVVPTKKLAEQDVAMLALQHPRFGQSSPASTGGPATTAALSPSSSSSAASTSSSGLTTSMLAQHNQHHTNTTNSTAIGNDDQDDDVDDGVSSLTADSVLNSMLSASSHMPPAVASSLQAQPHVNRPSASAPPPMPMQMPLPPPPALVPAGQANVNYKNILQDWAQSQFRNSRPIADVIRYEHIVAPQAVPSLQPAFQCNVQVTFPDGHQQTFYGVQTHTTKKAAEQEAARVALYSRNPHFDQLVSRMPR